MRALFLILLFILTVSMNGAKEKVKLTVKITNIEKVKGVFEISFFNKSENFLKRGCQYKKIRIKVVPAPMYISVELPKGTWALAMYQDLNADKVCNLNIFGVPTEPYAFSNNVRPFLSAPSFDRCKFKLDRPKTITVQLIN